MINNRKTVKKVYFTVEGETEKWYLEKLKELINDSEEALSIVDFKVTIEKNPLSYSRRHNLPRGTEVIHLCDLESEDEEKHQKPFRTMLECLAKSETVKYKLAYSNFSFDLWIILHKSPMLGALNHRDHYIEPINKVFNEKFENMHDYKRKDNFEKILDKLSLKDVCTAIKHAEAIRSQYEELGVEPKQHKRYKYYIKNPACDIDIYIKNILVVCGLYPKESKKQK